MAKLMIVGLILILVGVAGTLWLIARGVINWFYGPDPVATAERETYESAAILGCLMCRNTEAPLIAGMPAVICPECDRIGGEVLGRGTPITVAVAAQLREIVRQRNQQPAIDTMFSELDAEFAEDSPEQNEAYRNAMAPTNARTEAELRVASGRMAGGRRSWDLGATSR